MQIQGEIILAAFDVVKLVEMEKKLREEIRLRDKAEKRLKFLRGKLETVDIPFSPTLEDSQESRRPPITSSPEDAQLERAKSQITVQQRASGNVRHSKHLQCVKHRTRRANARQMFR